MSNKQSSLVSRVSALLVMILVVTSGAVNVSPSADAQATPVLPPIVLQPVLPATMRPYESAMVHIRVRNTTDKTWIEWDYAISTLHFPNNPGPDGDQNFWGQSPIFQKRVRPGETADYYFRAMAPSTPGDYVVQYHVGHPEPQRPSASERTVPLMVHVAGTPVDQDAHFTQISGAGTPRTVRAGEVGQYSNTGFKEDTGRTDIERGSGPNGYKIAFLQPGRYWGTQWYDIESPKVQPNGGAGMKYTVRAPATASPGYYPLSMQTFRIVNGKAELFGQVAGNLVTVTANDRPVPKKTGYVKSEFSTAAQKAITDLGIDTSSIGCEKIGADRSYNKPGEEQEALDGVLRLSFLENGTRKTLEINEALVPMSYNTILSRRSDSLNAIVHDGAVLRGLEAVCEIQIAALKAVSEGTDNVAILNQMAATQLAEVANCGKYAPLMANFFREAVECGGTGCQQGIGRVEYFADSTFFAKPSMNAVSSNQCIVGAPDDPITRAVNVALVARAALPKAPILTPAQLAAFNAPKPATPPASAPTATPTPTPTPAPTQSQSTASQSSVTLLEGGEIATKGSVADTFAEVLELESQQSQTYTDVSPNSPYYQSVELLNSLVGTVPCAKDKYCVDANLNRSQLATLAYRAAVAPNSASTSKIKAPADAFKDLGKYTTTAYKTAHFVVSNDLMDYADADGKTFDGKRKVTIAEVRDTAQRVKEFRQASGTSLLQARFGADGTGSVAGLGAAALLVVILAAVLLYSQRRPSTQKK